MRAVNVINRGIRAEFSSQMHPEQLRLYAAYLRCDPEDVVEDPAFFKDSADYDEDEMWTRPRELVVDLEMENLSTPEGFTPDGRGFTWGSVCFGTYKGRKVVVEQCASPLIVFHSGKAGTL